MDLVAPRPRVCLLPPGPDGRRGPHSRPHTRVPAHTCARTPSAPRTPLARVNGPRSAAGRARATPVSRMPPLAAPRAYPPCPFVGTARPSSTASFTIYLGSGDPWATLVAEHMRDDSGHLPDVTRHRRRQSACLRGSSLPLSDSRVRGSVPHAPNVPTCVTAALRLGVSSSGAPSPW